MNLPNAVRVRYEQLRSLDWTLITANYVAVGTALENPVRVLKITNLTDTNLLISINGLTDHDVVPANGFCLYDYGANKSDQGGFLELPAVDRIYVKQEAAPPTFGLVYVTVIYVSQV